MVSPNWPSDDDPDYTPDFTGDSSDSGLIESDNPDLEELKEDIAPITDGE